MLMFKSAIPVFIKGMECEKNVFAAFKFDVASLKNAEISICAASFYRLEVNGEFVSFGPARTAKGYAREDIISLDKYHREGKNEIVILVAGYYVRTLSTVIQPSFVCAEVRVGDEVVAASGDSMKGYLPPHRKRFVDRYSYQRHFNEVWELQSGRSFTDDEYEAEISPLTESLTILPRRAPYPRYEDIYFSSALSVGTLAFDPTLPYKTRYFSESISERWGCFDKDITDGAYAEKIQQYAQKKTEENKSLPIDLSENEYAMFDFSRIETGFIRFAACAKEDAEIIVAFSEGGDGDRFTFTKMNVRNTITYKMPKGENTDSFSFEPYVARYIMVAVTKGSITLNGVGIKLFECDISSIKYPRLSTRALESVYRGAVRTYAHNAVDIYTDCPSRERAGWLCDSYFTAKSEYELFGTTYVEDAFLENYRLYKNEGEYPDGVIPMCFPSDSPDDGKFIPQWTMWYVLEVEDYIHNRGHEADAELYRESISGLISFYERYENSDGLLEDLPSWNFVEWSKANEWTKNVNYPTNMLYAKVLESVYLLYGDERYLEKANKIRAAVKAQSFKDGLFYDHAVRGEDGSLTLLNDCSEVCQYYAILFGKVDLSDKKYEYLSDLVRNVFGAVRKREMPEIVEINAFIGVYLRLEALLKIGEYELVLKDIEEFFGHMERATGTLWEHRDGKGSLDHGFASYALSAILQAKKGMNYEKNTK